jgi:hypothetical protein
VKLRIHGTDTVCISHFCIFFIEVVKIIFVNSLECSKETWANSTIALPYVYKCIIIREQTVCGSVCLGCVISYTSGPEHPL